MDTNNKFNFEEQLNRWFCKTKSAQSITESDAEELKSHLLDSIDQLKDTGLSDEEAFWVASRRMGTKEDWENDYNTVNNQVIQLRRSVLILAGVLVYFCSFFFIELTSRLLFIISLSHDVSDYLALKWVTRYLIGAHFVLIIFITSIYFLGEKVVSLIETIKLKPKQTLILLIVTIIFGIIDTCLYPISKNITGQNDALRSSIIHVYIYFNYSFPLIICIGFTFLYLKYFRKAKI